MRLLFLCKRRPQGRDLLTRSYGRFYYLPYYLAQRGHKITILLLDYENGDPVHAYAHGMEWHSMSLRGLLTFGPWAYIKHASHLIKTQKPDWIVGFSDTWYGILAVYLGKKYQVKTLIDAYDNYESYIPWFKPLHWLWRYSLRQATALSAAGPQLAELMSRGRIGDMAAVVPMAADPIFQPLDNKELRTQLGLPENTPLVGYCGSLYKNRGINVIFEAIEILLKNNPTVALVISGRRDASLEIPASIKGSVIYLGYLPDEKMPLLLNALDVLMVINVNSTFGNYSYPVKLYEGMRCEKPVVASNAEGTCWILKDNPECLVESGDAEGLASLLQNTLLSGDKKEYVSKNDWVDSAEILCNLLEKTQI